MIPTKITVSLCAICLVSACGGSSDTTPVITAPTPTTFETNAIANANGTFTVESDGRTVELPASSFFSNGQPSWFSGDLRASAFDDADVLAIGGIDADGTFHGIAGTPTALSGSADFTGRWAVNSTTSQRSGPLELAYNFDAQSLTTSTGMLEVTGTVNDDGTISGSVDFEGAQADFEGGFFGGDTAAGAFSNDTIGGIFYGTQD